MHVAHFRHQKSNHRHPNPIKSIVLLHFESENVKIEHSLQVFFILCEHLFWIQVLKKLKVSKYKTIIYRMKEDERSEG